MTTFRELGPSLTFMWRFGLCRLPQALQVLDPEGESWPGVHVDVMSVHELLGSAGLLKPH